MDSPTHSQNIETREPWFLQVTTPEVPASRVIIEITRGLQSQEVIQAAWLEGSFGRHMHDRWSDIDLHLLVSPNNDTSPEEFALELLPLALSPLHIYPVIPHSVCQLVADNGIRLDIVVHRAEALDRPAKECCVLYDPLGRLTPTSATAEQASAEQIATSLKEDIHEFWRLIGMVPVVVGRNELLVGQQGTLLAATLLGKILARGTGADVASGVKRLERFLDPGDTAKLRDAVAGPFCNAASLVSANYKLIAIMRDRGPALASRWEFPYPKALEQAVLAYVESELSLLNFPPPSCS